MYLRSREALTTFGLMSTNRQLPDVTFESRAQVAGMLDKVGMSQIEVALRVQTPEFGETLIPAYADAYVNLVDPQAKGIHMSRLFVTLHEGLKKSSLSAKLCAEIADKFLETHSQVSDTAFLTVKFQLPTTQKALLSENFGFRHYQAELSVEKKKSQVLVSVQVVVPYSSTCPCSAALARQLIQDEFVKDFGTRTTVETAEVAEWVRKDTSIMATPHSQRSYATVNLSFDSVDSVISHKELIGIIEQSLKTPVQSVVKREDEQEFARLNAANLMFCEDAGRRLQSAVTQVPGLLSYQIKVSHEESLHPHNAVSMVSGYRVKK